MNEWVDSDFYSVETLTDIISRPTRLWHPPPSSFQKQLFAVKTSCAVVTSLPGITTELVETLQGLEKQAIGNVEHQSVHTTDTDLLRRLPTELLMDMAELLDTADFMSLRASCKWAFKAVDPLSEKMIRGTILDKGRPKKLSRYIDPETMPTLTLRDEIVLRFHRDRFHQLALSEVLFRTLYGQQTAKLLCSFCMNFHPAAAFSSIELAKGPERMCTGAVVNFRVCKHKRLSFKDIINLHQHCKVPGQHAKKQVQLCKEGLCALGTPFSTYVSASDLAETLEFHQHFELPEIRISIDRDRSSKHDSIKKTIPLYPWIDASLSPKDVKKVSFTLNNVEFRASLVALDEHICPHLRTSSLEVFEALVHRNNAHTTVYLMGQGHDERVQHATAKCSVPDCGAMYFLDQGGRGAMVSLKQEYLLLRVKRPVNVRLVTDHGWLAKLDIESL